MFASIRQLLISCSILLVCYYAQTLYLYQFGRWNEIAVWFPLILIPLTALFSIQFNQSRIAILSLGCLFYAYLLPNLLQQLPLSVELNKALSFSWLLTVAILVCLKKENGVFNFKTILFSIIAISPIVALFSLSHIYPATYSAALIQLSNVLLWYPLDDGLISVTVIVSTLGFVLFNLIKSINADQPIDMHFSGLIAACWFHHLLSPNQALQAVSLCAIAFIVLWVAVNHSYQLAYYDELTQLPSRRALNRLSNALGRKYIVVMADVDHFKKFNDTYGHDVGDQVLKLVASRLAEVGVSGKAFRYGGEEFTLIFKNKSVQQIVPELERLRQNIANYDIVVRDKSRTTKTKKDRSHYALKDKIVNVTISMGYAIKNKEHANFELCLKSADQALYRAKSAGRNCVSD